MSEIRIDDPEIHGKKSVDSNGRVYLGQEYAGRDIRLTVELLDGEVTDTNRQ